MFIHSTSSSTPAARPPTQGYSAATRRSTTSRDTVTRSSSRITESRELTETSFRSPFGKVVPAPDERVGTTSGAGHAYIFATSGTFIAMLTSPTPQSGGAFGFSVGLDGVTVVVGAPGETSQAGHAYIFATTGGSPIATLTSPNPETGGAFGNSVAISGMTVVVGAPFEDVTTTSAQTDAGRAYIFGPTTSGSTPSYTNGNFLSGGNIEIHQ